MNEPAWTLSDQLCDGTNRRDLMRFVQCELGGVQQGNLRPDGMHVLSTADAAVIDQMSAAADKQTDRLQSKRHFHYFLTHFFTEVQC